MSKPYSATPVPGDFGHAGGDCPEHGANVPHWYPLGEPSRRACVACTLENAPLRATPPAALVVEAVKALETARTEPAPAGNGSGAEPEHEKPACAECTQLRDRVYVLEEKLRVIHAMTGA